MLDTLLSEYDKTFHITGMTPINCSTVTDIEIVTQREVPRKPKYVIGDKVRIS